MCQFEYKGAPIWSACLGYFSAGKIFFNTSKNMFTKRTSGIKISLQNGCIDESTLIEPILLSYGPNPFFKEHWVFVCVYNWRKEERTREKGDEFMYTHICIHRWRDIAQSTISTKYSYGYAYLDQYLCSCKYQIKPSCHEKFHWDTQILEMCAYKRKNGIFQNKGRIWKKFHRSLI